MKMPSKVKKRIYTIELPLNSKLEVEIDEHGLIIKIKCKCNNRGEYEWVECAQTIHPAYAYTLENAQQRVNYLVDVGEIKL